MARQADVPDPAHLVGLRSDREPAGGPRPEGRHGCPDQGRLDEGRRPLAALEGDRRAYAIELLAPDAEMNPTLNAVAARGCRRLGGDGLHRRTLIELDPGSSLTRAPHARASSRRPSLDISIGLDPDLYPLLASSQTRSGGLNLIGLQDPTLDGLLAAARKPGDAAARQAAYTALQKQLAAGQYLLPLAFADEVVVARNHVQDVVVQPVGDPSDRFWDVLTWRLANDR